MVKVVRIDGQLAIVLPQSVVEKLGLKEGYFVDIFELKPGVMAITTKREVAKILLGERKEEGARPRPPSAKEIAFAMDELSVIRKLLSFKYEQRIPPVIDKQLSSDEKKVLASLLQKGAVRIYKGGKYKDTGVYDIPRETYGTVMRQLGRGAGPAAGKSEAAKGRELLEPEREEKEERGLTPLERLEKEGYLVMDSETEARRLSDELKPKRREIRGLRGFDRKYYVVKNSFIMKHAKKIRDSLAAGNKTTDQLAAATGLPRGACVAILTIMNEEGEVIEKRRGVFVLAE